MTPGVDISVGAALAGVGARVRADVPLAGLTTLRVGGPARVLAECPTTQSLVDAVRVADARAVPVLVLGGGSNLLVADAGFDGVVLAVRDARVDVGVDSVVAQAGADWDAVVSATVSAGLGGLECLSGIPGSAGATPVQNVGAYGVEVASALRRVRVLDRASGEVRWMAPGELAFGYRDSALKRNPGAAVVLAVEFGLHSDGLSAPVRYRELAAALGVAEGERAPVADVRAAVLALRARKAMVLDPADCDTWSAGSFFTNPIIRAERMSTVLAGISEAIGVNPDTIPQYSAGDGMKLSAGWLIERAGFAKGYPGAGAPARLSTKHALALTNRGSATAADIAALAADVHAGVAAKFGVELEPEPVFVGLRPIRREHCPE